MDGFDECSGDHREQLGFLLEWMKSTQGKKFSTRMCLASQPLPEIRSRLSAFPGCEIHEWNASDISEYVIDRLGRPWNDLILSQRCGERSHDAFTYLVNRIVQKAQGIFLWVEVVVNNLTINVEEGSTDLALQEYLDSLPTQLEELYDWIIKQNPETYISEARNYIRLVLLGMSRHEDWGILQFCFATRGPDEVLSRPSLSSDEGHLEIQTMCDLAEMRIKSRCRGLLQVRESKDMKRRLSTKHMSEQMENTTKWFSKKVEFLHRSVHDHFASTSFRSFPSPEPSASTHDQETSMERMVSSLGLLKLLNLHRLLQLMNGNAPLSSIWTTLAYYCTRDHDHPNSSHECLVGHLQIDEIFRYWSQPPRETFESHGKLLLAASLSELNRICTLADQNWHSTYLKSSLPLEDKDYGALVARLTNVSDVASWSVDLLCLGLANGLDLLVQEQIKDPAFDLRKRSGRPLLCFAFDRCILKRRLPNIDTLRLLLEHGAKPNENYAGRTSWKYALSAYQYIQSTYSADMIREGWESPLYLLVEHGANPNQSALFCSIHWDNYGKEPLGMVCRLVEEFNELEDDSRALIKVLIKNGAEVPVPVLHLSPARRPMAQSILEIITEQEKQVPRKQRKRRKVLRAARKST